jgi:hypothetical protein
MSMWRVETEFTGLSGAPYLNQLFFDVAAGTAVGAASAVDAFWGAVDAGIDSDLTWARQTDVQQINEVNGDLEGIESVAPGSGTGGTVGEVAPTVIQALVRWRTEVVFGGRLLQGRTFIPGIPEGALSNGTLLPASQTVYQDAANAMIATVTAALVIWRRPIPPPDAEHPDRVARDGAFAHVVNAGVPTKFSVLRSRRD